VFGITVKFFAKEFLLVEQAIYMERDQKRKGKPGDVRAQSQGDEEPYQNTARRDQPRR
jgi:hypothetical protein